MEQSRPARSIRIAFAVGLAVAILSGTAGCGDGGCSGDRRGADPMAVRCGDCPQLYENNPEHPEINAQGLRDREFAVPKPEGVFRILVLGDSVPLGIGVPPEKTFPKRLETLLSSDRPVEVVNAAVAGYTPFNELHYYRSVGRRFEPDLVLVCFCMNDIADPALHWIYTREPIDPIPPEAIPNPAYHASHVQPIVDAVRGRTPMSRRELSRFLAQHTGPRGTTVNGRTWPTYVTGEDSLDIRVLLDDESPESRWLHGIYTDLAASVRADGARIAFALFPLAYQLDPDYPFLPQRNLMRFCQDQGIDCVDLLPALRAERRTKLFRDKTHGMDDVWHLNGEGHRVVAAALADFLVGRRLPGGPVP